MCVYFVCVRENYGITSHDDDNKEYRSKVVINPFLLLSLLHLFLFSWIDFDVLVITILRDRSKSNHLQIPSGERYANAMRMNIISTRHYFSHRRYITRASFVQIKRRLFVVRHCITILNHHQQLHHEINSITRCLAVDTLLIDDTRFRVERSRSVFLCRLPQQQQQQHSDSPPRQSHRTLHGLTSQIRYFQSCRLRSKGRLGTRQIEQNQRQGH